MGPTLFSRPTPPRPFKADPRPLPGALPKGSPSPGWALLLQVPPGQSSAWQGRALTSSLSSSQSPKPPHRPPNPPHTNPPSATPSSQPHLLGSDCPGLPWGLHHAPTVPATGSVFRNLFWCPPPSFRCLPPSLDLGSRLLTTTVHTARRQLCC